MLLAHVNLARGFRGGERQTALLIEALAARGLRQRLVARAGDELLDRVGRHAGLERTGAAGIVAAARALRGADLVHVHQGRSIQAAALAYLVSGKPYLVTRRVMSPIRRNRISRWMYTRAAAVVALSSAVQAELARYDPRLEAAVIPSAWTPAEPDPATVAALRERAGGRLIIGNVAALDQRSKGQLTLIEAATALPQHLFVLVGTGPDEARLREAAAGLGNVVFTGQVCDVASHLAAFDVFAFPSYLEGLGSILLDAMRAGLPIVAHGVGGIPDLVRDGDNGYLIAPGDTAAFTTALADLADDVSKRRGMAARNRELAADYSPEVMANRYERVYEKLLAPNA
ncbi:MAG: glycosyltransferase family 4 protein [Pseudomonadota bacterium]